MQRRKSVESRLSIGLHIKLSDNLLGGKKKKKISHAKHRLCPCGFKVGLFFWIAPREETLRNRSGLVRDLLSLARDNKVRLVGENSFETKISRGRTRFYHEIDYVPLP